MPQSQKPSKKKKLRSNLDPNDLPVTKRRAGYLAAEAGLDASQLSGKTVREVNELLKWRVDPQLLLFRRVCGQVVKKDPLTGELCPVPNATVHVEDTDCTFLGMFPVESPSFWLHLVSCSREELATVTTDACGRFCVNLPYWDIDRILRWRRKRICFPDIYKPRLRDLIDPLPDPPDFPGRGPQPDPLPIERINPELIERVRGQFGQAVAGRLEAAAVEPAFGALTSEYADLLDLPLPSSPPPLPRSFRESPQKAFEEAAGAAGLDSSSVQEIDSSRFYGPFVRCKDVITAEWMPFFDVPDITFRVTQDVDGDGDEEQIYGEGFFDVRWNEDSPLNVTLEANATAICVPICEQVGEIPCENVPVISTVANMPLEPTYHDDSNGYEQRVNRPSPPDGDYPPTSTFGTGAATAVSPYAGTLNLHGCQRVLGATHYRLTYSLDGTGPVPFTGITWSTPAKSGPPIHVVPDADGWYPNQNPDDLVHENWLLHWNTRSFANGTYDVRLEVGRPGPGGMTLLDTSAPRKFRVDNKRPDLAYLEVRWRYADISGPWTDGNSTQLPAVCPVINRDLQAIRIRVSWSATAPHLRHAKIGLQGCGGGTALLVDPSPGAPDMEAYRHWHRDASDNTVIQSNEFEIPSTARAGCYTLRITAGSRGFEPRGTFGPTYDWLFNHNYLPAALPRAISVVNI